MEPVMQDPSSGIPLELSGHIHLLLNVPFPRPQPAPGGLPVDKVIEILLQAVQMTRRERTVSWQFLDAPPDGTLLVAWQPPSMENRFATDGYEYADVERAFSQQARGYTVEMYIRRAGIKRGEKFTSHCRRRFRVTKGNPAIPHNPSLPSPDPNLWLVQYAQVDAPQDRLPLDKIPADPMQHMLTTQRDALRNKELTRKEFMLHDRDNWPTIGPPQRGATLSRQKTAYRGAVEPPPLKRQRQTRHVHPGADDTGTQETLRQHFEEDEHVSGDILDHLTPREISYARFIQHAEWMEEIFSSPYETGSIVPPELGIGRKGEIESLTGAFFDSPTHAKSSSNAPIGRMASHKAHDFRKSVTERLDQINVDIVEMKRKHAQDIAEIQGGSQVKQCIENLQQLGASNAKPGQDEIDVLTRQFEAVTGKTIRFVNKRECVQKGGLAEKTEQDQRAARHADGQDTAAPLGFPSPLDFSQGPSMTTRDVGKATVPPSTQAAQTMNESPSRSAGEGDVEMNVEPARAGAPDVVPEDWVMVGGDDGAAPGGDGVPPGGTGPGDADLPTEPEPETGGAFDTTTFDDSVDFGNLDTAGDALAGFTPGDAGLSLTESGDIGLEDSAFEDAYHPRTGASPGQDAEAPGSQMRQ